MLNLHESTTALMGRIGVTDVRVGYYGQAYFVLYDSEYTRVTVEVSRTGRVEIEVKSDRLLWHPVSRYVTTLKADGERRLLDPRTWFVFDATTGVPRRNRTVESLVRLALTDAAEWDAHCMNADEKAGEAFLRAATRITDGKRLGEAMGDLQRSLA